jgi:pimeloyl-ACP methyl ester carboxylesterase
VNKLIKVNNGNVVYYSSENGKTPLLIINGFADSYEHWQDLLEIIETKFNIYCPNLPGYWGSDKLTVPHNINNYAKFTLKFIEELKLTKVCLFGESLGSQIALEILRDHDIFDSVCLLAVPIIKSPATSIFSSVLNLFLNLGIAGPLVDFFRKIPFINKLMVNIWSETMRLSGNISEQKKEYVRQKVSSASGKTMVETVASIFNYDTLELLRSTSRQLSIIYGSHDPISSVLKKHRDHLPTSISFVEMSGKHSLEDEHPKELAENIVKLL